MEVKTVQQTSKDGPREVLVVILLEVDFGIFLENECSNFNLYLEN